MTSDEWEELEMEANKLHEMISNANINRTKEQKIAFLEWAGYRNPEKRYDDYYSYEKIMMKTGIFAAHYQDLGAEMFSYLASAAYSKRIIIPTTFRRFYRSIISEGALQKDEP